MVGTTARHRASRRRIRCRLGPASMATSNRVDLPIGRRERPSGANRTDGVVTAGRVVADSAGSRPGSRRPAVGRRRRTARWSDRGSGVQMPEAVVGAAELDVFRQTTRRRRRPRLVGQARRPPRCSPRRRRVRRAGRGRPEGASVSRRRPGSHRNRRRPGTPRSPARSGRRTSRRSRRSRRSKDPTCRDTR